MSNDTSNGTADDYEAFFDTNIDYAVGVPYLLLGILGIFTNGSAIWTFWTIRKTVKLLPFLVSAICLAYNDLIMCMFDFTPYAILILCGRPLVVNSVICGFVGFINNFCERFAWFNITSIMAFRCASLLFPLKCRNINHRPVLGLLAIFCIFITVISALPFFPLDFMYTRYEYIPNLAECAYQINTESTAMVVLIDVLWWGPFLTCVASCAIFVTVMAMYASKFKGVLANRNTDVIKKTVVLTVFFIVCYFPKAFQSLIFYLAGKENLITWTDLEKLGYPAIVYFYLVACYIIPAVRAACTPLMLRLKAYILMCNTSKRMSNAVGNTDSMGRKISKNSVLPMMQSKRNFFKKHFENKKHFDKKKKDTFAKLPVTASERVQLV